MGKIVILSTSTSTRIPNHKIGIDKRHMQTTLNKLLDRGSWENYKIFAYPVFITPGRYTMSSSNALPSAPLERIYPELPPDNFRLSRIGDVKKQISEEIENYRKVAKKYKKAQTAIITPLSVWSLSRPLSQPLATPLALYWPWNYRRCTSWGCCSILRCRSQYAWISTLLRDVWHLHGVRERLSCWF